MNTAIEAITYKSALNEAAETFSLYKTAAGLSYYCLLQERVSIYAKDEERRSIAVRKFRVASQLLMLHTVRSN